MKRRNPPTCAAALTLAVAFLLGGMAGTAQAQNDENIPAWVKGIFVFYADGQIDDRELIGALEYLIAEGIIKITAPTEHVMSAEAMSYTLDADALEAASRDFREANVHLKRTLDVWAENVEPAERRAWDQRAEALIPLLDNMDMANAVLITSMRAAAADGNVTLVERADVDAAKVAADTAVDLVTEIVIYMQHVIVAGPDGLIAGR